MSKTVNILGSSGSVGVQTVDVVKKLGYRVRAISVGKNIDTAMRQIWELKPELCAVTDDKAGRELSRRLQGVGTKIIYGEDAAEKCATLGADICVNAISGFAGLRPTMAALEHCGRLAIANKETLVAAGKFVKEKAADTGCEILPVDSEHSAVFQCLAGNNKKSVKRLILTCSGGAFYGKSEQELNDVTLSDALAHPTWNMGGKITVDCATLMNKGLEVIEAMHLFDVPVDNISVVIHRESIIHSMVEYDDNTIIAQLGPHDMRLPIQYALTYPDRCECPCDALDLASIGKLSFSEPDTKTFPSLSLAYEMARRGGLYPCAMNAANEVAVDCFIKGKISFSDIYNVTAQTLKAAQIDEMRDIYDVYRCHKDVTDLAREIAKSFYIK